MNSLAYACALVGTAAAAIASPTDRVIIAAMSLSEQRNYSWLTMVDEDSCSYELEGKTTAAGITWIRMPMVRAVARRIGREHDTQLEALFCGSSTGVVRIEDDWRALEELPGARELGTSRPRTLVRGSANAGSFGIAGGQSIGAAAPFLENKAGARTLSALQFGVTHPHEELAVIVSSFTDMNVSGDVVSGTLSDRGAGLLLVRVEHGDVEPVAASGEFKLWLQRGTVVKYQVKVAGVVSVGRWTKREVRLNAVTTLREIGSTRVTVPDTVLARLR